MENKTHISPLLLPVRIDDKAAMKAMALISMICFAYIFAIEWQLSLFTLDSIDKQSMILLNYSGGQFADKFWYGYSQKIIWAPLVLVTVVTLFVKQKGTVYNKLLLVLGVVLMVVVLDQVSSSLIKPLVGRLRPSHTPIVANMLHYVNGYHGGKFGFISGHATNTVGIAVFLAMIFRNRLTRLSLAFFALLMCYSRIYLGVHYPGDILCGALLGAVGAWLTIRLLRRRHVAMPTRCCPWTILGTYYLTFICLVIYA